MVIIRRSYIRNALEVGCAVAFVLILLVADIPVIYPLVESVVVKPEMFIFEIVRRVLLISALYTARILGIVVESKVTHFD